MAECAFRNMPMSLSTLPPAWGDAYGLATSQAIRGEVFTIGVRTR